MARPASPIFKFTEVALIGHGSYPKTKRHFHVTNSEHGGLVGEIKWYTPWRRYCFFSLAYQAYCVLDEGGLAEITQQLEALNSKEPKKKDVKA